MALNQCRRLAPHLYNRTNTRIFAVPHRNAFFSKKEAVASPEDVEAATINKRKAKTGRDKHFMKERLNTLATKTKLTTKKGYKPPARVEETIEQILTQLKDVKGDWRQVSLTESRFKYKILTKLMDEFNHNIPNAVLSNINTVQDAVNFFETEVRDTTTIEDIASLDLPKNLHIQLESLRFDPETDKFFEGRTAFPGEDTIVSSIKYKRKYESIKVKEEKAGFVDHYYGY